MEEPTLLRSVANCRLRSGSGWVERGFLGRWRGFWSLVGFVFFVLKIGIVGGIFLGYRVEVQGVAVEIEGGLIVVEGFLAEDAELAEAAVDGALQVLFVFLETFQTGVIVVGGGVGEGERGGNGAGVLG